MLNKIKSALLGGYKCPTKNAGIVDVEVSKRDSVQFKKVQRYGVRLTISKVEKMRRKKERLLKKIETEKSHQRSLDAFNRLFELDITTNSYISRSENED